MKKAYRQGEIIITPVSEIKGNKRKNLIIAEGETTGHKHCITKGEAELYEHERTLFLRVNSDNAELTHEEHKVVILPKGDYEIEIQREYIIGDDKYRKVSD